MIVDWDGTIRMYLSAPCTIQRLFGLKDRAEIGVAHDTYPDRHVSATKLTGLPAALDPREKS